MTISLCTMTYGSEPYKNKHEFSIRWGANYDFYENHNDFYYWSAPLENYNSGKYHRGNETYTEAITLSYSREMKRWITLSINASYYGLFQSERDNVSNKKTDTYRKHKISVYPMVRFTYLNRPVIRLYSSVGLGLGVTKEGWSDNRRYYNDNDTYLDGQLTFFGISIGKKLFVLGETGIGAMGFLTVGGGYRF